MVDDRCPYCKKLDAVPEVAHNYTETYGGGIHHVKCNHCKKVVKVYMKRIVMLQGIEKTDRKDADWK
jgi:hypothetical protein